jgi:hypothetical protein
MCRDAADQIRLAALEHKPLFKPRSGHDGEQVYASMWEATMLDVRQDTFGDAVFPIDYVLSDYKGPIEQRQATVLATVACWLGCNWGADLLRRAATERDSGRWPSRHAYLIAWTLSNHRERGMNGGVRTIEYMLAPEELRKPVPYAIGGVLSALPALSADDVETVDHLMAWLAEQAGQRYLARCDAKLEGIRHEKRLLEHADWLRERDEALPERQPPGSGGYQPVEFLRGSDVAPPPRRP